MAKKGLGPEDHFRGRLRELREAAGLSQRQVGEAVGVPAFTVSRWETGRKSPGWLNVLALCRALGVTPDAFCVPAKAKEPGPEKPKRPRGRPKGSTAKKKGGGK